MTIKVGSTSDRLFTATQAESASLIVQPHSSEAGQYGPRFCSLLFREHVVFENLPGRWRARAFHYLRYDV